MLPTLLLIGIDAGQAPGGRVRMRAEGRRIHQRIGRAGYKPAGERISHEAVTRHLAIHGLAEHAADQLAPRPRLT